MKIAAFEDRTNTLICMGHVIKVTMAVEIFLKLFQF